MKSNFNPSTPPDRATFITMLRASIREVEDAAAAVAEAAAQLGESESHAGTTKIGHAIANGYRAMIRDAINGNKN